MSTYKNGKSNHIIDVLIDIADKYNVSLDWLVRRSEYTFVLSSIRYFILFIYELVIKKKSDSK